MQKRLRILKISENKIFITPNDSISFHQTNFPRDCFGFKSNKEIYWQVELINYDEITNSIDVNVLDYQPNDLSSFNNQLQRKAVEHLNFKELKWGELEPLLSWYKPIEFEQLTHNTNKQKKLSERLLSNREVLDAALIVDKPSINPKLNFENDTPPNPDEKFMEFNLSFKYYFKDASFKLGFVSFNKYLDDIGREVEFKIYNNEILPEYNYIKYYFPKVFNNRKRFTVNAIVTIRRNNTIDVDSSSKEIECINEKLIDTIKKYRVRKITGLVTDDNVENNLFSANDLISQIDDFDGRENSKENELDIIKLLLAQKDIRNKKHLEYLSGYEHNPSEKILFTLKPIFGFLFFIEGEDKNHYCWELLNSHATYLWSFDKNHSSNIQINRIEKIISLIREIGRNKYKSNYGENLIDSDILFNVVNHSNSTSDSKDGFIDWKLRLKELLL